MINLDPTGFIISQKSNEAGQARPGRKTECSLVAGWRSLLLQTFEQPSFIDVYDIMASPDYLIVLVLAGGYQLESFSAGSWKRAAYRPGTVGITAASTTNRLRWHSGEATTSQLLRIYIPPAYFAEVSEEYRRAGRPTASSIPDALTLHDPLVFSIGTSLANGARTGVPDLYAETGARFLATHLLSRQHGWSEQISTWDVGSGLSDQRLKRVIDFMRQHLAEPLTLEQLAGEAGISRFHFSRLLRKKTGLPPHRLLIRLRMERAMALLKNTDLAIYEIAGACGYVHLGHFALAFQAQTGQSPSAFRGHS